MNLMEVFIMAVKKMENKFSSPFEMTWNWETGFGVVENMEQKSLEAIQAQKEWINSAYEQLSQLEDSSKKMTTEWRSFVQNELGKAPKEMAGLNATDWITKFEEIGHKSQNIAFSPAKSTLDLLSQYQANFESIYETTLTQIQKNRSEMMKPFEGIVEQMKQTQATFYKAFEMPIK